MAIRLALPSVTCCKRQLSNHTPGLDLLPNLSDVLVGHNLKDAARHEVGGEAVPLCLRRDIDSCLRQGVRPLLRWGDEQLRSLKGMPHLRAAEIYSAKPPTALCGRKPRLNLG